ncbi:MAG: undecaprenyl-diphosphate phosphatase [Endomicrobiaceae bacterium]
MEFILFFKLVFLGIIEGLTEFLPVSSTGHLIIFADIIDFNSEIATLFEIVIQLGAILAVVWLYRRKILNLLASIFSEKKSFNFALNLLIAFVPAAVVGFFFHDIIKSYLFNPLTVAVALVVGGFIILYIENKNIEEKTKEALDINKKSALIVGLSQILSLIPGVSRAGATIMGGVCSGLSRKAAAEFSFFLAIPIMFAASLYDLYKNAPLLNLNSLLIIAVGFISAFISAIIVIKWFIKFISSNNFKIFGWYRIVFGIALIIFYYFIKG